MKAARVFLAIFLSAVTPCFAAQNKRLVSDQQAIALAARSVAAMSGGSAIRSINLNTNVVSILGSTRESGTGMFFAKGTARSRVELTLSTGTLSEVRSLTNGVPAGAWSRNGAPGAPYVAFNTVTDAIWFFPALSSLTQHGNPDYLFKYIGLEQFNGISTQHIQVSWMPSPVAPSLQSLSKMDFYLEPSTCVPVGMLFQTHPDNDARINIPVEIRFADYRAESGVQIPHHFQRLLNGSLVLDVTVTGVELNAASPEGSFVLP